MPASPSRRAVLRGLVGLTAFPLVSGCSSDDDNGGSPGGGSTPDPDLRLLADAVSTTQDLLAAYEATLARHAQLVDRLKPMRANHAAHLAALTSFRPDLPTVAPGPDASASPSAPSVPAARDQAVEALAAAELAAAGKRVGQARNAHDPELARLVASIGGSEAAHTAVLRAGAP